MKPPRLLLAALLLSLFTLPPSLLSGPADAAPELGLAAYTFIDRSFSKALDRAAAMRIKYIQANPKQKISSTNKALFRHDMDDATKAEVRALLKAKNITLTSYGNIIGKDEADWRAIFAFAKEMGLRDIVTEPKPEDLPLLDRLSRETGVAVAIHNHAPPNRYANPDTVLTLIKPYGPNIGFCADTGHWARSGYDPVAALKKAAGRIINLHFKDLNELGKKTAHDVPWGTGASNAAQQLAELRRQGFTGIAYMEYEHITPKLESETAASAAWFQKQIKK